MTCLAWSRPTRRLPQAERLLQRTSPSTFPDPPMRLLYRENLPPRPMASSPATFLHLISRATEPPGEPRLPSCESAVAKVHRRDRRLRLFLRVRAIYPANRERHSWPHADRQSSRSARGP